MAVALFLDERDDTTSAIPCDDNRGLVGCHETVANPAIGDVAEARGVGCALG